MAAAAVTVASDPLETGPVVAQQALCGRCELPTVRSASFRTTRPTK